MKKTIAIVEDERAIRDNYAAAFSREGYAVRGYPNRREAMTAFASRLPDLAVIDISLEDEPEGGLELCRELRGLSAERRAPYERVALVLAAAQRSRVEKLTILPVADL